MKLGMRWQSVSTCIMSEAEPVVFAQLDQPVEYLLPIAVAGEIIVGDKKAEDPLRRVGAHHPLDIVGVRSVICAPGH